MKITSHIRIKNKRKQVSVDDYIIEKLHSHGYTLDSFLADDLRMQDEQKLSINVQKLIIEKLLNLPSLPSSHPFKFTFIDLFSGIGGFRLPLEQQHGKCLGYSEIQWDSMRVYTQNYEMEEQYLGDIRLINKINASQDINMIVGGVPCQSWSSAGKNKGFDDKRGQLWLDTIRVVKENKPNCFLFENVQGLADPRHKESLGAILKAFEEVGYKVTYKVVSSQDFGLVQDRNRIFIVGFKNSIYFSRFKWPQKQLSSPSLGEILKLDNYKRYSQPASQTQQYSLFSELEKADKDKGKVFLSNDFNDFFIFSDVRSGETTLHSWDFLDISEKEKKICLKMISLRRRLGKKLYNKDGAPLTFNIMKQEISTIKQENLDSLVSKGVFKKFADERYDFVHSKQSTGINGVYRIYSPDTISFPTLTATGSPDFIATTSFQGETLKEYKNYFIEEIYKKKKFRSLTEREIARLQGFPETFKLCSNGFSNKQMGNAVSVPVINALFCSIKNTGVLEAES